MLERFTHGKERYVAFIENAFLERVQKDNVVYHGLAGHFFLRGVHHGLKVRVMADLEDRVRWDITGMNPTATSSGGRARLVINSSCFGEGTENVQFFTGGQTYACGQTLVDTEVTYDSRTGQVTITATGGTETYVQWVLTGTATRTN